MSEDLPWRNLRCGDDEGHPTAEQLVAALQRTYHSQVQVSQRKASGDLGVVNLGHEGSDVAMNLTEKEVQWPLAGGRRAAPPV